jgi:ATP-grasp ribosomal peptide maturase
MSTVLVVTALEDLTADWVIEALNEREAWVARVDPADIGSGLHFSARIAGDSAAWNGRLRTASREVDLRDVGAIYYRRPGPWRFAHLPPQQRDFAVAEARYGFGGVLYNLERAVYVNHPAAVTRADFKPGQLRTAVGLGLPIPPTLITNEAGEARRFAGEHGRIICKTFRGLPSGEDGHAGAIWTQRVDPGTFDESMAVTAHLFQAELAKIGDVRVTVVGRRVFAQQIMAPGATLDWRQGDWDQLIHAPIRVPPPVQAALHRYLAAYDLVFGCFDFALTGAGDDAGDWVFIECNPNGQWAWLPDADQIACALADVLSREHGAIR